jgi:hypothetical protein
LPESQTHFAFVDAAAPMASKTSPYPDQPSPRQDGAISFAALNDVNIHIAWFQN